MKTQNFTIPNRLASFNEIFSTMTNDKRLAQHREVNNILLCRYAIAHADLTPMHGNIALRVRWVEPTAKRSYAQISAATCFIERALLECRIIDPFAITNISHEFAVNPRQPRVEVMLEVL